MNTDHNYAALNLVETIQADLERLHALLRDGSDPDDLDRKDSRSRLANAKPSPRGRVKKSL